jgi:hypothetical protein
MKAKFIIGALVAGICLLDFSHATFAQPVAITLPATSIGPTSATVNGTLNPSNNTAEAYFQYGLTTNYSNIGGYLALPATNTAQTLPGVVVNALTGPAGASFSLSLSDTAQLLSIASSADGTRLAAGENNGGIYVSTNSGSTWTLSSAPTGGWVSIASSADGTRLAAATPQFSSIYVSTNGGATWTLTSADASGGTWASIASSADGMRLAANAKNAGIYTSTNGGSTWRHTSAPVDNWFSIASSVDGVRLAASAADNVYTSTNGGSTWTPTSPTNGWWQSVASSADGLRLVTTDGNTGLIYVSTNGGNNWALTTAPALGWYSVASSADGARLAAVVPTFGAMNNGAAYYSTDSGLTWIPSSGASSIVWSTVVMSADGSKMAGAAYGIYTSSGSVSPLTPGTTYHYRAAGVNSLGRGLGADLTFTTLAQPAVTNLPATSISSTNATLNGTVNPNGAATTAWFKYGLTTSYGSFSATNSLAATNAVLSVSNLIANLSPGTTYHVQLVASNSVGTSLGADLSFTTLAQPSVTTSPATSITTTNATLNGTVNPNLAATSAYFRYGLTTSYGSYSATNALPATNVAMSVANLVSNLTPGGATYHFVLVATNSVGTSLGGDLTFTTVAIVPAPTTLAASSITTTNAALNGTVNPNGAATTVYFQYGLTTNYGSFSATNTLAATNAVLSVSSLISNLTQGGTLYHFRLVAGNSVGTSLGNDIAFTTAAVAPAPTTLSASSINATNATLNGTVNPNGATTSAYFRYGTNTNYGSFSATNTLAATNAVLSISNLIGNLTFATTYHFQLVASNSMGSASGGDFSFTTQPLQPVVTTSAATSVTQTNAILNGTVNPNRGVTTAYFQYGLTTNYGSYSATNTLPATNTTLSVSNLVGNLAPGTIYHFRAVGMNSAGTSLGNDLTFTTSAAAPSSTTLSATGITKTNATLNGSVNPNGAATSAYFQYGLTTNYGSYSATNNFPATNVALAVSSLVNSLTPGTTYHFQLVASNSGGVTAGADLSFTTFAVPAYGYGLAVLADHPLGYWPLDETNGVLAHDYYRMNDGGYTNAFLGQPGNAVVSTHTAAGFASVGGNNSLVSAVTNDFASGTSNAEFSVECWAKGGPQAAGAGIISKGFGNSGEQFILDCGSVSNGFRFYIQDAAFAYHAANGTVTPDNNWHHLVGVCDEVHGFVVLYVDGTSNASATVTPGSGLLPTAIFTTFGARSSDALHYSYGVYDLQFNGSMEEVAIYNYALTAAQAHAHYLSASNRAPTVTTLAASGTTATNAILNGTVNPNGASTIAYFQYGLTTSYGNYAATNALSATNAAVPVSNLIGNLALATTYHFQLVASNSLGISLGSDLTFTTAAVAPTPTTLAASGITATNAALNGTVNPNGGASSAYFQYGLTTSYGSYSATNSLAATNGVLSVSNLISNLSPATTWHFQLVAGNSAGTNTGSDLTLTTGAAAPFATTMAASAITSTNAALNGTVNPNGATTTAYFRYGLTTSYGNYSATNSLGATNVALSVSNLISNLTPGTLYHYQLIASNSVGTITGADFTVTSSPTLATPTTLAASSITATNAMLNGTVNPNGASTKAWFRYGLTTSYGSFSATNTLIATNVALSVSNLVGSLTPGTLYHFQLMASNSAGTSQGTDLTFTTSAAAPVPTTLAATSITSTNATLNGTVKPNGAATAAYFRYGLTTSYGSYSATNNLAATNVTLSVSNTVAGLSPGTSYHFQLVATNSLGTNVGSDLTFTTGAVAPTVNTLAASGVTSSNATLNGSVNPNGAATTVYFRFGLTTSYGSYSATNSLAATNMAISVSNVVGSLTPGTTYHFQLVAGNSVGTNAGTDLTLTTGAAAPIATTFAASGVTSSNAILNGTVDPNGAIAFAYFAYGLTTNYGSYTATNTLAATNITLSVSDLIGNLAPGTNYHFQIVAGNSVGTNAGADLTFATGAAAPLVTTFAASGVTSSNAILNGTVNPNGVVAFAYFAYGLTTNYGSYSATNTLAATNVTLSVSNLIGNLTPGTNYHFQLVAGNSVGTNAGADVLFTTAGQSQATSFSLNGGVILPGGAFQFSFTNLASLSFTVLGATNIELPLSNWTVLGTPVEGPAGQYQFTDQQATNTPIRFYRVRSP